MEETVLAWNPQRVARDVLIDHLVRSFFAEIELAATS
jgi:hypothetical protein